jgi:hypothetical protein
MKFEPFYSLILMLREKIITRESFIYEWGLCQWAQRKAVSEEEERNSRN